MRMVIKGKLKNPCGNGTVQYLDCGGKYTNLQRRKNYRELNTHTCTQMSTNKTGEI